MKYITCHFHVNYNECWQKVLLEFLNKIFIQFRRARLFNVSSQFVSENTIMSSPRRLCSLMKV